MTDTVANFHLVSDGYDPAEVDRRMAELVQATKTAQQHLHDLHSQVGELTARAAAAEAGRDSAAGERDAAVGERDAAIAARDAALVEKAAAPAPAAAPDFASLGEHIASVLQAATEAADRIRTEGLDEIAAARATVQREIEGKLSKAQRELGDLSRNRNEVVAHLTRLRDAIKPADQPEAASAGEAQPATEGDEQTPSPN
jgi:cell division protein FtsB